jgi:hypothetical protein
VTVECRWLCLLISPVGFRVQGGQPATGAQHRLMLRLRQVRFCRYRFHLPATQDIYC